jgi:hypothetical protein
MSHRIPDANRTADTVQGDFLAEETFHQQALFFINHPLGGIRDKLTVTRLTAMMLLAIMNMAVFLQSPGSTLRTRVSYVHGNSPLFALGE